MRRVSIALVLVLNLAAPLFAWSDAGHKIIASIAYSELTEKERQRVVGMLIDHPRFNEEFHRKITRDIAAEADGGREFIFQQAAIWPDIARGYRGDDAKLHHATWHFINIPHFLRDADKAALAGSLKVNVSFDPPADPLEDMNAIQLLCVARRIAGDRKCKRADRALMLSWIFHVIGDIHQPLHSSALFSQKLFPDGDNGRTQIKTVQGGNLRSLWDGLLGHRANYREAYQAARSLLAEPEMVALGEDAAQKLTETDWLEESRQLAVSVAYSAEVMDYLRKVEESGDQIQPIDLDEGYLTAAGAISERRVVQAGYRLAAVLKQIVDSNETARQVR